MKTILLLMAVIFSSLSFANTHDDFHSKVSPQFKIYGKKCYGGELSGVGQRICQKDEWLVSLNERTDFVAELDSGNVFRPLESTSVKSRILLALYTLVSDSRGELKLVPRVLPHAIDSNGNLVP